MTRAYFTGDRIRVIKDFLPHAMAGDEKILGNPTINGSFSIGTCRLGGFCTGSCLTQGWGLNISPEYFELMTEKEGMQDLEVGDSVCVTEDVRGKCRLKGDVMTVMTIRFMNREARFFPIDSCRNGLECRAKFGKDSCEVIGYGCSKPYYVRLTKREAITQEEIKNAKGLPSIDQLKDFTKTD